MVAVPHGEKADLDQVREDFPFPNIINTHCIAKTNFFIILIGDQPASLLENFRQFLDLDWRKVWKYFVYLEEFQRFLRLSAVKSLEITC